MIWESSFWKLDMIRRAHGLRRRLQQRRWTESSFARLEQELMLGFYSVRKLVEASKLSDNIVQRSMPLVAYPSTGSVVNIMNWHHLDRHYDFGCPHCTARDLLFVCNQVIHSYVFAPLFGENTLLSAVLFNSDRTRFDTLFSLEVTLIADLFEEIGANDPESMVMLKGRDTGLCDVKMGPTLRLPDELAGETQRSSIGEQESGQE
ncbi:MAG: hypothetical protein JW889_16960 [Verrucomicrobia bacterium]|nr:hypothetical protein [Verrucomicrobiota bacterium]